jgi:hypothetical protein
VINSSNVKAATWRETLPCTGRPVRGCWQRPPQ